MFVCPVKFDTLLVVVVVVVGGIVVVVLGTVVVEVEVDVEVDVVEEFELESIVLQAELAGVAIGTSFGHP